jgi:hypothetical protein
MPRTGLNLWLHSRDDSSAGVLERRIRGKINLGEDLEGGCNGQF